MQEAFERGKSPPCLIGGGEQGKQVHSEKGENKSVKGERVSRNERDTVLQSAAEKRTRPGRSSRKKGTGGIARERGPMRCLTERARSKRRPVEKYKLKEVTMEVLDNTSRRVPRRGIDQKKTAVFSDCDTV